MSSGPTIRSNKGCWTCRVRHKKCDETRPACQQCTSRSVKCHGYDERPEWFDGGPLELQRRNEIKMEVKRNCRLIKRRGPMRRVSASSKPTNTSNSESTLPASQHLNQEIEVVGQAQGCHIDFTTPTVSVSVSREPATTQTSPTEREMPLREDPTCTQSRVTAERTPNSNSAFRPKTLSYRDAELLMHYLDHVFPRQFRFHTQDISRRRGRGWLLWLLTKTGPLYQAALSLSALHQFILHSHDHGHKYAELNEYHTNALRDLRVFLELNNQGSEGTGTRSGQIEVLACGVSLISFELYRGGVSDWQPHLSALASIVMALELDPSIAYTKKSPETPFKPAMEIPRIEDSAIPFLVAVVLWFDLVSCASTGTAPCLPYKALIWDQGIDLERIMGCQNWAMIVIGDLATLNAWKKHARHTGTLEVGDLVARSQVIEHQLEQGLAILESSHSLEMTNGPPQSHAVSNISRRVTRVFASATLVQLHTFMSGSFPNLPKVRSSVDRTISALEQITDIQDVRGLIWPVCIAGCMAVEPQQPFFETLIENVLGDLERDFGNAATILRIMKHCWHSRRQHPDQEWNWERAMCELDICALLV